jgi:hypothetical protein
MGCTALVDEHPDLGAAAGRANAGDKLLTLVMSALAGGDTIDDAEALRSGGTGPIQGSTVNAASTLGTFLRSFRWGHVRQLDRVSRELLGRAWTTGGPGAAPFTIDLDSTICRRTVSRSRARSSARTPTSAAITRSGRPPPGAAAF